MDVIFMGAPPLAPIRTSLRSPLPILQWGRARVRGGPYAGVGVYRWPSPRPSHPLSIVRTPQNALACSYWKRAQPALGAVMPRGSLANWACGGACLILFTVSLGLPASAQAPAPVGDAELAAVMDRLSITLPPSIAYHGPVRRLLETLGRERCDSKAIADLGTALERFGHRREAAKAHIGFSEACGGQPESLRRAVNILADLNDYRAVIRVADDLIKLEPFSD